MKLEIAKNGSKKKKKKKKKKKSFDQSTQLQHGAIRTIIYNSKKFMGDMHEFKFNMHMCIASKYACS